MSKSNNKPKCNLAVAIPVHMSMKKAQDHLARLSKGLAHPIRARIITMLAGRPHEEKCYCGDIVKELPVAQSTVSQHLKILKDTGWVQGEIHGPRVCYCLVDGILDYYQWLLLKCVEGRKTVERKQKRRGGK